MIAALAFVAFFLLAGIFVLFFAFGGSRGKGEASVHGDRGRKAAASLGVAVVCLAFGVAVPGLVIAHNNNSQSRNATGGLKLSEYQKEGRQLFAKNCSTCHTLAAANAVGKVGPNLDTLASLDDPAAARALVENAITVGRAQGNGQMPAGLLSGEDVKKVASFVAVAHGR